MTTPNVAKDETYITSENVKCYSHSGKQFGSYFQKRKMQLPYDPSNCGLGHSSQRNENLCSHKYLCINIYSRFIRNSPKLEITQIVFHQING